MSNKIKWVALLLITVILLYFIYRKYKYPKVEPFDAVFPSMSLYNQDGLNTQSELGVVFLDFIYNPNTECTITRQFLSGCCQPIENTQLTGDPILGNNEKILVGRGNPLFSDSASPFQESKVDGYRINTETPGNTFLLEDISSPTPTQIKVFKSMEYLEGNKCPPIQYYAKEICNLSEESTLFHLNDVFADINQNYNDEIYNPLNSADIKTFTNEFGMEIKYEEIGRENDLLGIDKPTELNKLFHFHLALRVIPDPNNQENAYPKLKLQIPKEKDSRRQGDIIYETKTYSQNVNNIDQIMEFIYQNIVINVESDSSEDTSTLKLFDAYYNSDSQAPAEVKIDLTENQSAYEMSKFNLYQNLRQFDFDVSGLTPPSVSNLSNTQGTNNMYVPNYLKLKYQEYKNGKTRNYFENKPFDQSPQLYFIHENKILRNRELNDESEAKIDYLTHRPNLYWENINTFKNTKGPGSSAAEFDDDSHLIVLLEDAYLTEYYTGDSSPHNLVYWFAWDISKTELSIIQKSLERLKLGETETFSELYPYQLLNRKDNSFYREEQYWHNALNNPNFSIRHLNLHLRIIPVTYLENEKYKTFYRKYLKNSVEDSKLPYNYLDKSKFYRDFFNYIPIEQSISNVGLENRVSPFLYSNKDKLFDLTAEFRIAVTIQLQNARELINQVRDNTWLNIINFSQKGKEWNKTTKFDYGAWLFIVNLVVKNGEILLDFRSGKNKIDSETISEDDKNAKIQDLHYIGKGTGGVNPNGSYTFTLEQSGNILNVDLESDYLENVNERGIGNDKLTSPFVFEDMIVESRQSKYFTITELEITSNPPSPSTGTPHTEIPNEIISIGKYYRTLVDMQVDIPYKIEGKNRINYEEFLESSNELQNNPVTLFNYGEIHHSFQAGEVKVIHLPYFTQYQILLVADVSASASLSPTPSPSASASGRAVTANEITIDDKLLFTPVEKNYTFYMPYETKVIKIHSKEATHLIIKPSNYLTRPFVWKNFFPENVIAEETLDTLKLDSTKESNEITIKLSQPSNFMIHFKSESASTDLSLPPGATASSTLTLDRNDKHYLLLNTAPTDEITIKITNLKEQDIIRNGVITFLPDNFVFANYQKSQEYIIQNNFIGRIKNIKVTTRKSLSLSEGDNCPESLETPITSHQILPSLKWKHKLNPSLDNKFAIRAFYVRPDGTEKTVYLAWDLKKEELEHHYRVFPSYRENEDNKPAGSRKYGPENSIYPEDIVPTPSLSPAPASEENKFFSIDGGDCKLVGETNLINDEVQNLASTIPNYNRHVAYQFEDNKIKDTSPTANTLLDLNNPKLSANQLNKLALGAFNKNPIEIINRLPYIVYNLNGYSIEELNELNFRLDSNNKTKFESDPVGDSSTSQQYTYSMEYNSNLGIWQIFRNDHTLQSWVANQKFKQNPLSKNSSWIFSPEYHYENYLGKYDFFDFPNQFNKDQEISMMNMNYVRTVYLNFNTTDKISQNYHFDCDAHKGNITTNSIPDDACTSNLIQNGTNTRRYFYSTLFNLPNISETNSDGELINLDSKDLTVDPISESAEGNLIYNMMIRVEIIPYQRQTNSVRSRRKLSDLVLDNYLDSDLISGMNIKLKEVINGNTSLRNCLAENRNKLIEYFYDEIKDELLSQRGDTSQVKFSELFQKITNLMNYNTLDQIPNIVRTLKVIKDTQEISKDLEEAFFNYINPGRIVSKNYYSYGNLNLKQNETIITYEVPVDIKCFYLNKIKIPKFAEDVLFKIQKSVFYSNLRMIQALKNIYLLYQNRGYFDNNQIDKFTYYVNQEKCGEFDSELIIEYSKEIDSYLEALEKLGTSFTGKSESVTPAGSSLGSDKPHQQHMSALEKIMELDFTYFNYDIPSDSDSPDTLPICATVLSTTRSLDTISSITSPSPSLASEPAPSPDSTSLAEPAPSPDPTKGAITVATKGQCKIPPDFKKGTNNTFLKLFKISVPILQLFHILQRNIYDKDDLTDIISSSDVASKEVTSPSPSAETSPSPSPDDSSSNSIVTDMSISSDDEKKYVELLEKINLKLQEYNSYLVKEYNEICKEELPIIKEEPEPVDPRQTKRQKSVGYDGDIFGFYKDMIFSVFDRD